MLGWEEEFDEGLGVEGRRWIYLQVLDRTDFLAYAAFGTPNWQPWVWSWLNPMFRVGLVRYLGITGPAVEKGMPIVEEALCRVERRLASGAQFLVGDTFTAADLTFASLMSPLILPNRYGIPLPEPGWLAPDAQTVVDAFRARPAGEFAPFDCRASS